MKKQQKQPSRGFLRKRCLKICGIFTGEHPCQRAISIKLLGYFIEITLRHGFSLVNLLHIFRTAFLKNTSGGLLLTQDKFQSDHVDNLSFEVHATYFDDQLRTIGSTQHRFIHDEFTLP